MVKSLSLKAKIYIVNQKKRFDITFYCYDDVIYSIIYKIIEVYKNHLGQPKIAIHNRFNKMMAKLKIEIELNFDIYQSLWICNDFHLGLKLGQKAIV